MKALLAALALTTVAIGPADARPSGGAAIAAPSAELDRLVRMLVPDQAMIDLAARMIDKGDARDADARALYRRYPGLKDRVAARVRPQLARIMKRELPPLRRQIGAIIAAEMSPAEIAATAKFFATPTGRKVHANALRAIADTPGRNQADANAAVMQAVMSNLAPGDTGALLDFGTSGAAAKIGSVNPRVAAASRAWAERVTAKHGARIRKLAKRAAADYVARARKAKA